MKKHRIFSTLIESQKKSYELIMTSVLIAIGVNLLSTGIVELLGIQNKGIILIVIASLPKEVAKPKEQGETSYIIEKNI